MNILPHGAAWNVSLQAEQPLSGDYCVFREQRLYAYRAPGWEVRDILIGRFADICITLRHIDSNDTAELTIKLGDALTAVPCLEYALVRLIARLGDSSRADSLREGEAILDRITGAIEGARAAIAANRAALAPEVAQ